jgi:hypothetical protein
VTFCTFNAAVREKIALHTDRYEPGGYCFAPTIEILAKGPGGFIY